MAIITLPHVYTPGQILPAAFLNDDFQTIYNDYNGNITNANLSASAGIALTKLQLNPGVEAFNQQGSGGNFTWASGETSDTDPRLTMTADGHLLGGPGGTTTPDVGLQRTAPGTWQLSSPSGTPTAPILDMNGGSIINLASFFAPYIQGLRISISSSIAIPSDGTSTSINAVPYTSGSIALYNASNQWVIDQVTSLSISMPATTNTIYDVYVFDNSGVATIGLAAWSGSTPPTRGMQNGVPYTNNNVHDRWIGSVATNGTSGTTEDDTAARLVWNYNNQVPRALFAQVPVANWTYSGTWRASDGNTTNGQGRFSILTGLANSMAEATFHTANGSMGGTVVGVNAIGINSTISPFNGLQIGGGGSAAHAQAAGTIDASLPVGVNYIQMLEQPITSINTAFFLGNSIDSTTGASVWMSGWSNQ